MFVTLVDIETGSCSSERGKWRWLDRQLRDEAGSLLTTGHDPSSPSAGTRSQTSREPMSEAA
jgi:hypothetical protein